MESFTEEGGGEGGGREVAVREVPCTGAHHGASSSNKRPDLNTSGSEQSDSDE